MLPEILYTKLQRPHVAADMVPRPRLLEQLEGWRKRPLTLISAPAGYGKTSLTSRWVEACDCFHGWISLDQNDCDLRTFLSYFFSGIRPVFLERIKSETLLEATHLPAVKDIAHHLLNDLQQNQDPFILVLDDYHIIEGTPAHDLVSALLDHPCRTMHLVLLTRRDPSLPLATMRGRGQVKEIRAVDLRLTKAEIQTFLAKTLNVSLDDSTALLLETKTEGWATGLRLASIYLQGEKDLKMKIEALTGNSRHVAQYLVAEVLSRQKPELVTCLLKTSIVDRFCSPLCSAIHDEKASTASEREGGKAQQFLQWLVNSNLFIIPLDDQGNWFRFHHLFREFLQERLHDTSQSEERAELHRRASLWFAENDLPDEAIEHALLAGRIEMAVDVVLENRHALMNTSQFFRLNRWLAKLPEHIIEKSPLLTTTKTFISLELGQDLDFLSCRERANRILSVLPEASPEYVEFAAEVAMLRGFTEMCMGDSAQGIADTQASFDNLPDQALHIRAIGTLNMTGCQQMQGSSDLSRKTVRQALTERAWPRNIRSRLHFYLSISRYMDADLPGSMVASRDCLQSLQYPHYSHIRHFALYLLGAAHYLRNEIEPATASMQTVLEDYGAPTPSYLGNAGYVLACIHLLHNASEEAEKLLTQISDYFQMHNYATQQAICQAFQVECALRTGDMERATFLGGSFDFDIRPPLWFFYVPQITPIKLLLAQATKKSLAEARTRLAVILRQMKRINRKNVLIDLMALSSLVHHKQGEESTAMANLKEALDLAEPGGCIRNFADLGDDMQELLERLIQMDPDYVFARHVLAACRADACGTATKVASYPMSLPARTGAPRATLTDREIELLQLVAEGRSNKEIAEKLYISIETVKTHLRSVYKKLEAKGRIQAQNKARSLGLIAKQ